MTIQELKEKYKDTTDKDGFVTTNIRIHEKLLAKIYMEMVVERRRSRNEMFNVLLEKGIESND